MNPDKYKQMVELFN